MLQITSETLKTLGAERKGPCVSIYMPLVPAGPQVRQNPIRLSNLLREAEHKLANTGVPQDDARELLDKARVAFLEEDPASERGDGFALFLAPGFMRHFRVPMEMPEKVFVGTRLITRPLLPLVESEDEFYILALSQGHAQMWHSAPGAGGLERVSVPGMPSSVKEVESLIDPERSLQGHPTGQAQRGLHGHGSVKDNWQDVVAEYLHRVENAAQDFLNDMTPPVTLILAGPESTLEEYRNVSRYRALAEQEIHCNPEDVNDSELMESAWRILLTRAEARREEAIRRHRELNDRGRIASGANAVVIRAFERRVEELFLDPEVDMPGRLNLEQYAVERASEMAPDTDDLLDLSAFCTLRGGGSVHAVPRDKMPDVGENNEPITAILRG
ncbi:MAG: hypothetical protein ACOC5K_04105 [Chloroflexota bacterium]